MKPQTTVLWGYRSDEVPLPPVWPSLTVENRTEIVLDPSVHVLSVREVDRNIRRPVAGSLGCHVVGASCPHPDLSDTSTTLEGALYRFCPKIPGYESHKEDFRKFVRDWCQTNLVPLKPDTDVSVETWLQNTNYNQARKAELLRKIRELRDPWNRRYHRVKSFVKDEFYPDYKHARAINSRADEFKCLTGPIFQRISDVLFSRPEFIKKVPIHERPDTILRDLYREGGIYMLTDFSSFEAHFRKFLMEDCEFILYEYMTQFLPDGPKFMKLIRKVIAGTNHIAFKNILMEIEATRMSGEMNTSLGNGFANLMIILYICSITPGCENPRAKVEGDDSITSVTGVAPTTQQFTDFGCRIKLEKVTDICRASFCGMVFDIEDKAIITDPREVLATFGWTSHRYIKSRKNVHLTLLRCKALSLAYQYPACPILSVLARRMLYFTRSFETKRFVDKQGKFLFNQYDIELFRYAEMRNRQGLLLFAAPGIKTRKLVEELYGITIEDQISIENYIESMEEIGPLDSPVILALMPVTWCDYYAKYSACIPVSSSNFDYPTQLWPRIKPEYKSPLIRGHG